MLTAAMLEKLEQKQRCEMHVEKKKLNEKLVERKAAHKPPILQSLNYETTLQIMNEEMANLLNQFGSVFAKR